MAEDFPPAIPGILLWFLLNLASAWGMWHLQWDGQPHTQTQQTLYLMIFLINGIASIFMLNALMPPTNAAS